MLRRNLSISALRGSGLGWTDCRPSCDKKSAAKLFALGLDVPQRQSHDSSAKWWHEDGRRGHPTTCIRRLGWVARVGRQTPHLNRRESLAAATRQSETNNFAGGLPGAALKIIAISRPFGLRWPALACAISPRDLLCSFQTSSEPY